LEKGANMGRVALLLSGEHPTLPRSEAIAILQSERVPHRELVKHDQLLILEAGEGYGPALAARSALTMEGGRFIQSSALSYGSISDSLEDADWGFLRGRSFGVKVTRVKEHCFGLDTQRLQGEVGYAIRGGTDSPVNLRAPDVWIRGVITDGGFFVFSRDFATDRTVFAKRRPKSRPFFHPGVLEPKLGRAFVNLSRVRGGDTFLDPFCGTGGFLIEGGLMGLKVVGMDLDAKMVRGAARNLRHYSIEAGLIHGDARRIPLNRADGIATDPPYGRGTSTMGGDVKQILEDFLLGASSLLDKGKIICTAAPIELDPSALARRSGYEVREEHRMRVHKSLTRSIVVAERS
jgi:tRNA (guanine10-N2)-dimethyltransferase